MIGAGLAGLSFALRAAQKTNITLLTKTRLMESNSSLAQGGIAAVTRLPDNFQKHIMDTMKVGQGISSRKAVETLVRRGPYEIEWLTEQGVEFSKYGGELDLTREGGHSSRRIVHAEDMTGYEVQKVLVHNAVNHPNIQIFENIIGIDLIIKKNECLGLTALDVENACLMEFFADYTVLATGGVGQLYSKTSNPEIATGDGIAMAWRAGAVLRDLEFTQFHPSILDIGNSPYFLISEAVRGEGGILVNSEKEAFMTRYHSLQDLAPRDVVSRAIVEEQKKGKVYLDIRERGKEYLIDRFPGIYNECNKHGIIIEEDLIPVSPAAHYFCGGVKTNTLGETNIHRLLVFGESACSGVHGANRLASNSTLECLAFTHLASEKAMAGGDFPKRKSIKKIRENIPEIGNRLIIQDIMWRNVGINRSLQGLFETLRHLEQIYKLSKKNCTENISVKSIEDHNLLCLARIITKAAYNRRESRGTHSLIEFYTKDDKYWRAHLDFQKETMTKVVHR